MKHPLVSQILSNPAAASGLDLAGWDKLVRQARHAGLLARLGLMLEEAGLRQAIPPQARWHFDAERVLADRQVIAVRWEVGQIRQALAELGAPIVLLKGAAYVMSGQPAARGRLFGDIDLLVPRDKIAQAESALMLAGWHAHAHDAYDERYYREWMHEIPPMTHVRRGSVIDLHHAILPPTARLHPETAKLVAAALPLDGMPGLFVLQPTDLVLHSACHLFHDGELPHGLRDLSDLDLQLRHWGKDRDFWPGLARRAAELELTRPLFYALRYARHFFGTPIPDALASLDAPEYLPLMDALFKRALAPEHPSCEDAASRPARLAAYIRAHWLRMPPLMLAWHLLHKAFISGHAPSA